jgi:hypothetical protein
MFKSTITLTVEDPKYYIPIPKDERSRPVIILNGRKIDYSRKGYFTLSSAYYDTGPVHLIVEDNQIILKHHSGFLESDVKIEIHPTVEMYKEMVESMKKCSLVEKCN